MSVCREAAPRFVLTFVLMPLRFSYQIRGIDVQLTDAESCLLILKKKIYILMVLTSTF